MTEEPRAAAGEGEPFTIEVFGVRWRICPVRLPAGWRDTLAELWGRAVVDPDSAGGECRDFLIAADTGGLPSAPDTDHAYLGSDPVQAPYVLSRAITLASIRRLRGQALMLHAVGVCDPQGRTAVLVAPSGTGKTTAASVLGKRLGYVSDETIVIGEDHVIAPYAKPLSIIVDTDKRHDKREFSPDELGLGPTPARPTLGSIALIQRDPELAEPAFELLPLAEAIIATIPETSALAALPDPLARLARALCAGGGPYRLRYAEMADCVDLVAQLASPEPAADDAAPAWEHLPSDGRDPVPSSWTDVTWDSVVTRTPWDDAVLSDGELVVLHTLVPSRLSRLGSALWQHSDGHATVAELHAHIVELMGEHPRSHAIVLAGLQSLVEARVLAIVSDPAPVASTEES